MRTFLLTLALLMVATASEAAPPSALMTVGTFLDLYTSEDPHAKAQAVLYAAGLAHGVDAMQVVALGPLHPLLCERDGYSPWEVERYPPRQYADWLWEGLVSPPTLQKPWRGSTHLGIYLLAKLRNDFQCWKR